MMHFNQSINFLNESINQSTDLFNELSDSWTGDSKTIWLNVEIKRINKQTI